MSISNAVALASNSICQFKGTIIAKSDVTAYENNGARREYITLTVGDQTDITNIRRLKEDMHFTWFSRRDGVFSHELTVSCPEPRSGEGRIW